MSQRVVTLKHKIFRYLRGLSDKGYFFRKNETKDIEIFTDIVLISSIEDRQSTTRYYIFVFGSLMTWGSKKQNVIVRGNVEAKFKAIALWDMVVKKTINVTSNFNKATN